MFINFNYVDLLLNCFIILLDVKAKYIFLILNFVKLVKLLFKLSKNQKKKNDFLFILFGLQWNLFYGNKQIQKNFVFKKDNQKSRKMVFLHKFSFKKLTEIQKNHLLLFAHIFGLQ